MDLAVALRSAAPPLVKLARNQAAILSTTSWTIPGSLVVRTVCSSMERATLLVICLRSNFTFARAGSPLPKGRYIKSRCPMSLLSVQGRRLSSVLSTYKQMPKSYEVSELHSA